MTRYGFGDNNEGWKESRKDNLAEVLKGLVEDMKCERKFVGLREGQKHLWKLMNEIEALL